MKIKSLLRNLAILLLATAMWACSPSQKGFYDANAIQALDKLTETMGALTSYSFTINSYVKNDNPDYPEGIWKMSDVYMKGKNKMYSYSESPERRRGTWYDGNELAVFLFDDDTYDIINAPKTTVAMIDSLNKNFRVNFPAADFFYPSLTDDIMANFDSVLVSGAKDIEGVNCLEINASNASQNVYILIDEARNLPIQLEIYSLGEKEGEMYVGTFSNWRTNPNLPDALFEFAPPPNSTQGSIFK